MKKKFAIVLALFLIAVVCSAGCIDPETPVDPVDPVVPVDPVTPVDPVDPVVPVEEYSVMFMLNYGDAGAYTAETVKAGETVSKPATPTRSGYTFKGWFTAAEGGAEYDFTQAVNADVTLYAQWKKKSSSSSSSSSSSGSTNSNAHLQGTTVTPSIGNAVTGDGSSTSVTGTVTETSGGNTVVTVTDPSGVKMDVTYESGSVTSNDGKTVTGDVSSVTVTYPEKDAGTASADSPDASSSLQLELTKAVGTLPTIDSDFKQDVSSKITTAFSGDKPLAMITASNTEQVNSGAIKEDGLAITFKLTGLSDGEKTKLVGYHVSGDDVETVTPDSVTSTGDTTTVVLKGDSFSSWAVGIAKDCPHNDLKLTHDAGTTFDKATHSGNCGDCDSAVNERCTITETTQAGGSILHECSKCGYQYSKAGSEMNLDSVTIPEDGTITSAAQLFRLAQLVNAGEFTGDVTLGIDIDLAGVEWTPIGTAGNPFSGVFNGNGKTISNLKITSGNFIGLFGYVADAEITNVHLVNAQVSGGERVAALIGKINGDAVVRDCSTDATSSVTGSASNTGGLIGEIVTGTVQLSNLENNAKVENTKNGNSRSGGIVGQVTTNAKVTLTDCTNKGAITTNTASNSYAGGIVSAYQSGTLTIRNCENTGTLTGTYNGTMLGWYTSIRSITISTEENKFDRHAIGCVDIAISSTMSLYGKNYFVNNLSDVKHLGVTDTKQRFSEIFADGKIGTSPADLWDKLIAFYSHAALTNPNFSGYPKTYWEMFNQHAGYSEPDWNTYFNSYNSMHSTDGMGLTKDNFTSHDWRQHIVYLAPENEKPQQEIKQ